jgi:hypothetical protein
MQVGDVVTVSLVGEYADGTRSVERAEVISSNLGVLQVVPWPASPPPYDKTYVKAIAPGTEPYDSSYTAKRSPLTFKSSGSGGRKVRQKQFAQS